MVSLRLRETEISYCPKVTYGVSDDSTSFETLHAHSTLLKKTRKNSPRRKKLWERHLIRDPLFTDGWQRNRVVGVVGRKFDWTVCLKDE